MDYSQNAEFPQLGANQPGKSYYLSPRSIYIFGIALTVVLALARSIALALALAVTLAIAFVIALAL